MSHFTIAVVKHHNHTEANIVYRVSKKTNPPKAINNILAYAMPF